jgi:hypothetical protein
MIHFEQGDAMGQLTVASLARSNRLWQDLIHTQDIVSVKIFL